MRSVRRRRTSPKVLFGKACSNGHIGGTTYVCNSYIYYDGEQVVEPVAHKLVVSGALRQQLPSQKAPQAAEAAELAESTVD